MSTQYGKGGVFVAICPISLGASMIKNCNKDCVLLINSECALKTIAEKVVQSDNSKK